MVSLHAFLMHPAEVVASRTTSQSRKHLREQGNERVINKTNEVIHSKLSAVKLMREMKL